jgi:Cdc6-like AAA superfamily ATPase
MTTSDHDYRRALDAATREYEVLGEQRRQIDDRLAQLAQTMGTLNRLLGLTPTVPFGLTDACRLALRGAGLPLTPLEVRDRLLAIGMDLSVYTNELSAIHTILKRLNHAGEIRVVPRGKGKAAYVWNDLTSVAAKDAGRAKR